MIRYPHAFMMNLTVYIPMYWMTGLLAQAVESLSRGSAKSIRCPSASADAQYPCLKRHLLPTASI